LLKHVGVKFGMYHKSDYYFDAFVGYFVTITDFCCVTNTDLLASRPSNMYKITCPGQTHESWEQDRCDRATFDKHTLTGALAQCARLVTSIYSHAPHNDVSFNDGGPIIL
jgi:hypothetical protein